MSVMRITTSDFVVLMTVVVQTCNIKIKHNSHPEVKHLAILNAIFVLIMSYFLDFVASDFFQSSI